MKRGKQGVKERACISFRLLHPGSENMSSCSGLANPLDMVKLQKKKRALEACFGPSGTFPTATLATTIPGNVELRASLMCRKGK